MGGVTLMAEKRKDSVGRVARKFVKSLSAGLNAK